MESHITINEHDAQRVVRDLVWRDLVVAAPVNGAATGRRQALDRRSIEAMPDVRIAGNDPALAHAVARHGIGKLGSRSERLRERLHGLTDKQAGRVLRAHFGDLLIAENLERLSGTRSCATWVALDAEGEDLVPVRIVLRRTHHYCEGSVAALCLRLSSHCMARILQRTLHIGDVRASGSLLAWHIAEASRLIEADAVQVGDTVATASPEGALLWAAYAMPELRLHGQTWVAADTADDPGIRAACTAWRTIVRKNSQH